MLKSTWEKVDQLVTDAMKYARSQAEQFTLDVCSSIERSLRSRIEEDRLYSEAAMTRADEGFGSAVRANERLDLVVPALGELCCEVQRLEHRQSRHEDAAAESVVTINHRFNMLLEHLGLEIARDPLVQIYEDGEQVDFTEERVYIRKAKGGKRA